MTIVVTGGAGFIGSNLVKGLNQAGYTDIVVVDNLTQGQKFRNLVDCQIKDYVDQDDFLSRMGQKDFALNSIEVIFHQGACSSTTEWDGRFMLHNNFEYSKNLLHFCLNQKIPFIYASSAAVYGLSTTFQEDLTANEKPLNVYGYSKLLLDHYVRGLKAKSKSQIVGLRYFNVYGPGEFHKGSQASTIFHFNRQLQESDSVKLFKGTEGIADGEQLRDFVWVEDIVSVILWFWKNPQHSGIFNVGTGQPRSFNDVAKTVIRWHGRGKVEYIPFPDILRGHYQNYTCADLTQLRRIGYRQSFTPIEVGIPKYLAQLNTA